MKTVARTFLLLFLCSLQGKAAFYSDKAANLLNTLDSLIENYPQVIEQRQSAINRIASKPMPNTLQARYEHNKRLFQEYQYFNIDSALVYVNANIVIAQQTGDDNMMNLCRIQRSYIYAIIDATNRPRQTNRRYAYRIFGTDVSALLPICRIYRRW